MKNTYTLEEKKVIRKFLSEEIKFLDIARNPKVIELVTDLLENNGAEVREDFGDFSTKMISLLLEHTHLMMKKVV